MEDVSWSFSCFKRWPDETVYISRKQQMRPVFESGWYVISVYLFYIFFPVLTKIMIFLSRFFLWFLFVLFQVRGFVLYFSVSVFLHNPNALMRQEAKVIICTLIWPLLFWLLQVLGAVKSLRVWPEVKKQGLGQRHICPLLFFSNISIDLHVVVRHVFF